MHLWRKVAEPGKNGVRKVYLMWTVRSSHTDLLNTFYNFMSVQGDMLCTLLIELPCFILSTQEIPSTCQGTFTYTIKVNHTDTLCGNTTCDIDVNQDAYRLNLTVFHNEVLLAEESVYVPAIGESEF